MRQFHIPFTLRDYQQVAVDTALSLIESSPEQWHLFASPTGTGKSLIELEILSRVKGAILCTPRLEIVADMLTKLGERGVEDYSDITLARVAWDRFHITTPIRLRNMLIRGELDFAPGLLIQDEMHHDLAETYQDITMYLNGVPKIGFTATPYRGTPNGTRELLKQWGDTVNRVLSLRDAVEMGYYHVPEVEVWPLIDDDLIAVSGGEFQVKTTTARVKENVELVAERSIRWFDTGSRMWDMPTIYSVPSTDAVESLTAALRRVGLPVLPVTQSTSRLDRIKAFDAVRNSLAALVQINVVSEGVDLPIRRIVDLRPTMSPVFWFQQVGRIRAAHGAPPPQYICGCRNLERHCYLWEGLLPNSKIKAAQEAFVDAEGNPRPSTRSGVRVTGLEGLGKFARANVRLLDGTTGFMYNLVSVSDNVRTEYLAFVHPNYPDPVYGVKQSTNDGTQMLWGKWRLIESLPELKGCTSAKLNELSPKQKNRWLMSAADKGIDPNVKVTAREFQILPFLLDTGLAFH